jgi:hypothetical protein
MTLLAVTLCLLTFGPDAAPIQDDRAGDRQAVQQAALDYVEGIYLVDPKRIERSVHPMLAKRGFWREPSAAVYGPQSTMTFEQLVALAASWNKGGTRDTTIKKVEVLDVLDQTAIAKVTASWGIDYLQLAKYDGRWKTINILWQAHPR